MFGCLGNCAYFRSNVKVRPCDGSSYLVQGENVSTETGKIDVTLGEGCTWNLTADTYITSFTGDASRIKSNGYRLFVNGKELKTKN